MSQPSYITRSGLPDLAYVKTAPKPNTPKRPYVVFLGGFRSDMGGTKAVYLEEHCKRSGQGYLRLDYSGHGQSNGDFNDGTIGLWARDALDVIKSACAGEDVILVGSSMGGWIGLLLSIQYKQYVKGFVGIAAAPDFSIKMYNLMDEAQRKLLNTQGYIDVPNDYSDEPYRISKALIDDGAANALLEKGIDIDIPVHLIQGKLDTDVAWEHAGRIQRAIAGDQTQITLIDDADHRLSRPQDLACIADAVDAITDKVSR